MCHSEKRRINQACSNIRRLSRLCLRTHPVLYSHNDLPHSVTCNVSLYTDDTLLYAPINNDTDRLFIEINVDSLHECQISSLTTTELARSTVQRKFLGVSNTLCMILLSQLSSCHTLVCVSQYVNMQIHYGIQ